MTGPLILPFQGKRPRIHTTAWIAPTATIIGDVEIGPHASVFYGAVLRGDVNRIEVGARSNIQDNCVLHVDRNAPCILGEDVTVGHLALVHGATVGRGSLIGMKSALLSRSEVGPGSLIAAGAVLLEGQVIAPRSLAVGMPATVRRELSQEQSAAFIPHARHYVDVAARQSDETLCLEDVRFD
ncbi:gamma carbonic anhydrase family protein [Corynebacterium halotolerans]|uniref:gamma carbonic anhydrase family protein n=1 Tax=Corynebacterium halotolerans TaxID=225326 RepID=UPI003CEE801A